MAFTTMVREFTRACHDDLPATPTRLSREAVAFIREMVNDEMEELAAADSAVDQADALVDAIYYICDCAVRHGMNLDPLFAIVHQANMGKVVDGKVIRREDGKILKPQGWQAPEPLLEEEMARQDQEGGW
jgi:predicted HAD superfamily Cof-like phosphohydrolase